MTQPAWAFAVRGEGTDTLEIDVYDVIGDGFFGGVSAREIRGRLKRADDAKAIKLRVNSRGGDVFDGFAIYNLLHEHPARVEADVDGLAASMASVIIMAADEIRVSQSAMVMIHNPWALSIGSAEEMRGTAELLEKLQGQIADAYVARTGADRDRVVQMMDAETWLTADEAKELGFADVVKPAKSGAAEALAAVHLDGFKRVPGNFATAVAQARAASDRTATGGAPAVEETASNGGAKQRKRSMTEDELRAQHPDLYAAVLGKGREEGVAQERKRVSAHFKMADAFGAGDVAKAAILSGASISDEEVQADYMAAGQKARDVSNRQADDTAAGDAVDGAAPTPEPSGSDDWVVVNVEGGSR